MSAWSWFWVGAIFGSVAMYLILVIAVLRPIKKALDRMDKPLETIKKHAADLEALRDLYPYYITCKNNTGKTIPAGTFVYSDGKGGVEPWDTTTKGGE